MYFYLSAQRQVHDLSLHCSQELLRLERARAIQHAEVRTYNIQ